MDGWAFRSKSISSRIFPAVLFFWQLPQHVLGAALKAIFKPRIIDQVGECKVYYIKSRYIPGVSLGQYIFLNENFLYSSLRFRTITILHEYGHSRQSKFFGWMYLPVIGVQSFFLNILSRLFKFVYRNYYNFWTEALADRLAGISKKQRGENGF